MIENHHYKFPNFVTLLVEIVYYMVYSFYNIIRHMSYEARMFICDDRSRCCAKIWLFVGTT